MPPKLFRVLLYASILLNVFDIVLHIAINQPEMLRIAGNILIILGSGIALLGHRPKLVLVIGLIAYLILNCAFIALDGIGSAGMVFIILTAALTLLSLVKTKVVS